MSGLTIEKISEAYALLEEKQKKMPAYFDSAHCHPNNVEVLVDFPCEVVVKNTTPENIIILTNNGCFSGLIDLETLTATVFTEYEFRRLVRKYKNPFRKLPSPQATQG